MDYFLSKIGQQVFNLAVRSSISITSGLVLKKCTQLITSAKDHDADIMTEIGHLQQQLNGRINIVSQSVDLIQLRSTRGNPSLDAALPIATALHQDIAALGHHLNTAVADSDGLTSKSPSTTRELLRLRLTAVAEEMRSLIGRIDREIPLLQLAITTSGESMSTSLSPGVSPSRFLQASAFINLGDTQFANNPVGAVQIGPPFVLSLYMLFPSHTTPSAPSSKPSIDQPAEAYGFGEGARKPTWQEVCHKARVRIVRTPLDTTFRPLTGYETSASGTIAAKHGYAYHMEFVEDLDDGRYHDTELLVERYDTVLKAGIRESVPIHQISKILYADTGRLLNVGKDEETDRPVLLFKRDVQAVAPAKSTLDLSPLTPCPAEATSGTSSKGWSEQEEIDNQLQEEIIALDRLQITEPDHLQFPAHLDREWMALEIFEEDVLDNESESEDKVDVGSLAGQLEDRLQLNAPSCDSTVLEQMRNLCLTEDPPSSSGSPTAPKSFMAASPFAGVTTSLSLLELLVRLLSLQVSQQAHHLTTSDAVLNFFLEETSTTSLSNKEGRRVRSEAEVQLGFDPYEE
ncbi:RanGTP-binding protein [Plectosphaerella plurivora]|uniref:RanGTP-binding protein n=1 Tax=Plectosphaerella plurivora TaxID=936078 RepID=A0A9P9AA70_9PEZI|nr:RanGTP-binding protein [Plectosphaerella plurivora]